jgi:hypothetical protein
VLRTRGLMIESLNRDCFCASLDRGALREALASDAAAQGLDRLIEERCPNLFASQPVFVSQRDADGMAVVVRAVEEVAALPGYREAALRWAPEIAHHHPGARGVFMGYDFHLGAAGPQLIEINTNAGGALLNAVLARAQRACCAEIEPLIGGPARADALERRFIEMFLSEWRLAGRAGAPGRIAIVDDAPTEQYLYPEFLLFAQMFRRFGISADVVAPGELSLSGGELQSARGVVDLVYNRLTDFSLADPAHAAIRSAYLDGSAVVTPHPHAHALYADKRNLSLLSNSGMLESWGARRTSVETLARAIPQTEIVDPARADAFWARRRGLFFKPAAGHGSKAAYRGDKITRRVWEEVILGRYVAQALVPPSGRRIGPQQEMKMDVRNYAYGGEVQLLSARLYQGQTTNFRTAGGGFAPVFALAEPRDIIREAA